MSLPIHNAPAGDYPLGCLVPQSFPTHLPRFEDNAVTLKLDEIKAQLAARPGFAAFGRRAQFEPGEWVKSQGDHGSCCGWACATALEKTRVLRGQEWVKLSGADAYAQMNGGRDQGSALSDGMVVLQKSGIAPSTMVTVDQIFEHQISAQAKEARRRFRGFELYAADTEEEFASGILLGFLGVVAVHVTQGYDSLDGEGCPLSGNGPGNHSVHVDDIKLSPSGVILFDSPNNWTTRWGDQGRANYRWNQHLRECVKYHRFFLIRAAADDPGAANPGEVEG